MKFTEWSCKKIHFPKNLTSHVHSERYRGNGHNFNGVLHYFVTPVPTINTNKCNALKKWFFLIAWANYQKQTLLTFDRFLIWQNFACCSHAKSDLPTFSKAVWNFHPYFRPCWTKVWNLFKATISRFSPIPRTPNSMMKPRTPGSMMCSPCVFASSLNRGCGDSDALRKKFQTFVHDWIVGWTKVRTIFWIFHVYQNREKKM